MEYQKDDQVILLGVLAKAYDWLKAHGYAGETDSGERETLLDPECPIDAACMLDMWVQRCGLPSDIVAPAMPVLREAAHDMLGDADDACLVSLAEIRRQWIGYYEPDPDDSARTLHAELLGYANEVTK